MAIVLLPTELLDNILDSLSSADIIAVCLSNKRLCGVAQPHLYSSIQMTWTHETSPPAALLLRSLLQRPELGSHTAALHLMGHRRIRHATSPQAVLGTLENMDILPWSKAVATTSAVTSPAVAMLWAHEARSGRSDAAIALLVSMLPRLKTLTMSDSWSMNIGFLGTIIREGIDRKAQGGKLPSFESLSEITIAPRRADYEFPEADNTNDILGLFYLPNIQHLSASIDNPINLSWPFPAPPDPLHLTSLDLFRLRECRLEPILSTLRNLKCLNYHWFYCDYIDPKVSFPVVDLDMMAAAIAKCSNTLESLRIIATTALSYTAQLLNLERPQVTFQGTLSELSTMRNLVTLDIPWSFVIGMRESPPAPGTISSVISPSLQTLAFSGNQGPDATFKWSAEGIVAVVKAEFESGCMDSFTNLGVIKLPDAIHFKAYSDDLRADLDRLSETFHVTVATDAQGSLA